MKNGFLLSYDYEEQFEMLSDAQLGILLRAVYKYEKYTEIPQFDGVLKMAFAFIKKDLDALRKKYVERCEKNRENIYKRWNTNVKNNTDNDKNNDKKRYGKYKNILLSDEEISQLKQKYTADWQKRIENMSEGVEIHGYKYQNHYLALLSWAKRAEVLPKNKFADYEQSGVYDFDEIEAEALRKRLEGDER